MGNRRVLMARTGRRRKGHNVRGWQGPRPGRLPHSKILNLVVFAESLLLCKVTDTGSGDQDVALFGTPTFCQSHPLRRGLHDGFRKGGMLREEMGRRAGGPVRLMPFR